MRNTNRTERISKLFCCTLQVGLGIEEQLNELRKQVGLEPLAGLAKRREGRCLDYLRMVRPEVVLATKTEEHYTHSEDFFFR